MITYNCYIGMRCEWGYLLSCECNYCAGTSWWFVNRSGPRFVARWPRPHNRIVLMRRKTTRLLRNNTTRPPAEGRRAHNAFCFTGPLMVGSQGHTCAAPFVMSFERDRRDGINIILFAKYLQRHDHHRRANSPHFDVYPQFDLFLFFYWVNYKDSTYF